MKQLLITILWVVVLVSVSMAEVPTTMNYQGQLIDGTGPVTDTVAMTFTIYDESTGGNSKWAETHSSVVVADGLFDVVLGNGTPPMPIEDSCFFGADRWLEITAGGETITPRTKFVAAPYAFRVATVDGATGGIISGDVSIQSDLSVSGKATIGPGHTNSGVHAFVAGSNNNARGDYSVVAGGGGFSASDSNSAIGIHSAICGGKRNAASGMSSTVCGGTFNVATGYGASILGGLWSTADGDYSVIAGGGDNIADGEYSAIVGGNMGTADGAYSFIGAGYQNHARSGYGAVVGGDRNEADSNYTFIGGGILNKATGNYAVVTGGGFNRARGDYSIVAGGGGPSFADSNSAIGIYSAIGGGRANVADGAYCNVAGGQHNTASGLNSVVGGGQHNIADGNCCATVGGGSYNTADGSLSTISGGGFSTASGLYATIPGGYANSATGEFSFAAGREAIASDDRCFVWNDGYLDATLESDRDYQFKVGARGGVRFEINNDEWFEFRHLLTYPPLPTRDQILVCSNGAKLTTDGIWTNASSRDLKENFTEVDRGDLLEKISSMPITRWNYKTQNPSAYHIGPVAQDFHSTFGIGDDEGIAAMDEAGIALAAIQELIAQNKELKERVDLLQEQVEVLKSK